MANFEIDVTQEVLETALRKIETGDPVHADVYNALFQVLINNDAFLDRLANRMIQQTMIAHVLDSVNPNMVLGADQGPVIMEQIRELNSDLDALFATVDCHVTTVANTAREIPGAPKSANWIPVTIVHEGTLGCLEHIMSYGETWHIYSTVSQNVLIRFFKYPI